jgi:predicted HTH transcriptional regulator
MGGEEDSTISVISVERIRELVRLGNENRNLDYKGGFSWEEATNDEKCEIAKDILAFSNTRDGGVILIGVNDKSGALEGLTERQYTSFDQTKFNSFVHKYTDPRHTSKVHRIVVDEKRVVAIDIPEFADVPILCARDANSSVNQSKLILRRAALYMRTDKATSEPIDDADAMRELLNRGLIRRQDELLRAIKQIVLPNQTTAISEPGAEFKAEVEDAERYLSEL